MGAVPQGSLAPYINLEGVDEAELRAAHGHLEPHGEGHSRKMWGATLQERGWRTVEKVIVSVRDCCCHYTCGQSKQGGAG